MDLRVSGGGATCGRRPAGDDSGVLGESAPTHSASRLEVPLPLALTVKVRNSRITLTVSAGTKIPHEPEIYLTLKKLT